MDHFVLLAYASLAVLRTFLQLLLTCQNLASIQKIYYVCRNEKSDFYELWQQRKHLKTMAICEAQPKTYDEVYKHQFQTEPTPKIH